MKNISELDLKSKKVIIFDMDGTLIDSIGVWNKVDCELIYKLSGEKISEEDAQKQRDEFIEKNNSSDIYLAYFDHLRQVYHSELDADTFLKMRWEISNKFFHHEVDYKKGADLVLKKFKTKGFNLALATITNQAQLDIYMNINKNIMSKAHLPDVFDLVIAKENVTHKKPHPEVYLSVLKHFNINANQAIVFEDSFAGVKAAKNAGIEVVNVYDKYSDIDRCKIDALSDYKIQSYDEILDIISVNSKTFRRPSKER